MKWITLLICLTLVGCATPKKRPVHHRHTKKHIETVQDDAAMRALIRSLRE